MDEELKCHICNNMGSRGIILLDKYICRKCEMDLIKTPVFESEYERFRRKIKGIWEDTNESTIMEAYKCN